MNGRLCTRLGPFRSFATENPEPAEQTETPTEAVAEGGPEEAAEVTEDATSDKPEVVDDRRSKFTRTYVKTILRDSEIIQTNRADLEALFTSPNYGPFSFDKRLDQVTDENLARLHRDALDNYDYSKVSSSKKRWVNLLKGC